MNEISITRPILNAMCRLCLSSDVAQIDIFRFSTEMNNSVAGVITKCAPVQITREDELPNFICQSCYTQLGKTHQFLTQIELSDRTLRRYLQLLCTSASDKPIKAECFIESPEDPLLLNKDIVKCESLELDDVFHMDLNWKKTEPENFIQENKNNEEMCVKSEIKVEPIDVNLFLTTECEVGPEDISSNLEEFSCEVSKIDTGETKVSEDTIVGWKDKGEKPYKCNVCIKCFTTFEELKIHQRTHNVEKPYQCDVCKKCFSHSSNLYTHKRQHTGEKPYQCDICHKCFSHSSNLNSHKRQHTGEKRYQCDLCNKCVSTAFSLNQHKRIHTGEKPFQCNICEKFFTRSSTLLYHKRKHTGEKPYQCNICKKCFSHSSTLISHKLLHTGEKPYQCDLCNKRFYEKSKLTRHKCTHTDGKPYKCNFCIKCFTTFEELKVHQRTHTAEKPYQCDVCKKCFSQSCNLNRHKRKHN